MKYNIIPTTIFALALQFSPAHADEHIMKDDTGYYGQIGGGLMGITGSSVNDGSDLDIDFASGYKVYGRLGYDFGMFRTDVNLSYSKNNVNAFKGAGEINEAVGSFKDLSLFLNGYYDLHNKSDFTPYLGAGVGVVHSQSTGVKALTAITHIEDTVNIFGANAMVGTSYAVSSKVDLVAEYALQYVDRSSRHENTGAKYDFSNYLGHAFTVGLRYNF